MSAIGSYIIHGDSKLHFRKIGAGPKTLLAFHGYGMDLYSNPDFQSCFPDYTIYFFDLFYHGKSQWPNSDHALSVEKWNELMSIFFQQEKINRIALLGFSIGAKPLLAILKEHASRVDRIVLIAPDGIVNKFWYSLATGSQMGQLVFRKVLTSPKLIVGCMDWMTRFNLIPHKLLVFVRSQLSGSQQRANVYNTWMIYRKLKFPSKQLAKNIEDHSILATIFAGSRDVMFPPKDYKQFLSLIPKARLVVLDTDHARLVPAVLKFCSQNGYIA